MKRRRVFCARRDRASRRGVVLLVLLVLLSVVMLLTANWVRRLVAERQQLRRYVVEAQATRLAESGLARGRARLAATAAYAGEVWEIPADSWEAGRPATVRIDIEAVDSAKGLIEVTAKSVYPKGDARAVRRTRSALIRLPSSQP